jgi:hypothetical protein
MQKASLERDLSKLTERFVFRIRGAIFISEFAKQCMQADTRHSIRLHTAPTSHQPTSLHVAVALDAWLAG